MKWIIERDALIAQTMAFVQSVTGKKDEFHPPEPPRPLPVPPPRMASDFRTEMQARIANFRKHQERFEREREEYCAETLTKLRAAIRDASGPLGKK